MANLLWMAAAMAVQTAQPASVAAEQSFEARPCADARLAATARCGIVRVPENRDRPSGRSIDLNVIVLNAASTADLPPLFDIDGGPGLPATKNAAFYLQFGAAYRARRDIVLVDQRGTGGSNPLTCPELAAPEAAHVEMLEVAAVVRCRDTVTSRADLSRYGTGAAVEDLEDVRKALGYARIDIFALSYGTTVALRYMATYPDVVRAAVLMGVAPPEALPPSRHAEAGERALNLLFQDCRADPSCHSAFPDPAGDLDRAVARLDRGSGTLSPDLFLERLRSLMYQPAGARRIPWILHRAGEGDFEPFHAATRPSAPSLLADGMFLSVTCAESFGLMDYGEASRRARATRFGDYRLRRQRAACEVWPAGEPPSDHLAPLRSDAAVLLLSGRLDPVTPPEWAEQVSRQLPGSRHLVIPDGGHILEGLSNVECFDSLVVQFLETADAESLDGACLAQMRPPPFATGPAEE